LEAKIAGMKDKKMRKKEYQILANLADELYKKEKRLYEKEEKGDRQELLRPICSMRWI
jgi:hypothetical protein